MDTPGLIPAPTGPEPAPVGSGQTAPKLSGLKKFESILTGINKFITETINVEINLATSPGGKALIDRFLPPTLSSAIDTAEEIALNTYLQIEAAEQAVEASSVPYAQKVAQVIVLQGSAIAKVLASAGLSATSTDLQTLVQGATYFTQIPLANLTTLQNSGTTSANASVKASS